MQLFILTLDIIIPAILILIFGPFNNLYRKSTPFQNETKYLFICTLSPPCNLYNKIINQLFSEIKGNFVLV